MSKKIETIKTLLNCDHILVFINPRVKGVRLPQFLMQEESVTLKLSKYFQGELIIKDSEIQAVLKFNGLYQLCIIPEDSIWGAMTPDGQNILWLECSPESVKLQIFQGNENKSNNQKDQSQQSSRRLLKRIK